MDAGRSLDHIPGKIKHMNPNSANQWWSRWTFKVWPGIVKSRPFAEVQQNVARFARKGFGSGSEMNITRMGDHWIIDIRTIGHPVTDEAYVGYMRDAFERFFSVGFGVGTKTELKVRLEAGSKQDGTPAEQLIMLPTLKMEA